MTMLTKTIVIRITSWRTDSFESELMVPPDRGPTGLFKLLALLTMVATVLQYKALAKAFLLALHCEEQKICTSIV